MSILIILGLLTLPGVLFIMAVMHLLGTKRQPSQSVDLSNEFSHDPINLENNDI